MKKILIKMLIGVLSLCLLVGGLTACGGNDWGGTTMTNWGEVKSAGGFVAETDHYLYYINGMANSADDNAYGVPVKGALMAVDKSDMTKTEIVIPSLFAATDFSSGLFIDGEYVYYGTPNTDKASDGSVASSEMVFTKTKLDGTGSERLLKVNALSTEYRFVKGGDVVYIVYYDASESALISFDTTTKESVKIAVTDQKTESNYSLGEYKFVKDASSGIAVVYTLTVYSEPYIEDKAQEENYSRATETYNVVYAYKAGDEVDETTLVAGAKVVDGQTSGSKYALTLVNADKVFVTETTALNKTKVYGATVTDFYAGTLTEIKNAEYVASGNLIISFDEVYVLSSGTVYKGSMIADDKETKEKVAIKDTISKLLFVEGNDLYYFNSSNKIARIEMNNADADEIVVTENTVSTSWYAPELITVDGAKLLFYLDNSTKGASYVHYINVASAVQEKDTDDDGENDYFYLAGAQFVGKMTDADKASTVNAVINDIASELKNGALPYEEIDGELTVTAVTDAREVYEALESSVKELVDSVALNTLKNYEKAIEMANVYAKLDGMNEYDVLGETEQQALETAYEEVKDEIETFMASADYSAVSAYIENNAKWNYQKAVEVFEEE